MQPFNERYSKFWSMHYGAYNLSEIKMNMSSGMVEEVWVRNSVSRLFLCCFFVCCFIIFLFVFFMFVFTFYFSNDAKGLRPMPMGHSGPPGGGFPGGGDGGGPGGGGLSDDGGDDGDGPGPHRRKTHKTEKPEKPEKTPEKGRKQKAPVKDAKTTKATKDAKNAKKDATMKKKMTDKKVVKAPMKAKGK